MESIDYWRLCDELTIVQAASLIADNDPSTDAAYVEDWPVEQRPSGYEAAKEALKNALLRGTINGHLVPEKVYDINGNDCGDQPDTVDVRNSRVSVDSLRDWLKGRGFTSGFFFPEGAAAPDYLEPGSDRYAPKLAAAVRAWEATADPSSLGGRSPKQLLLKWLREHAAEFGLTDEDGNPNETGIEEVAKVANWRMSGGAPKTPG